MKNITLSLIVLSVVLVSMGFVSAGFDQYGYNTKANNFVGTCHSWYLGKLGGTDLDATTYCGAYDSDKLVMKWNEAWDACNAAGNDDVTACAGAWTSNEWNGMAGGSGETWHYKIIWVGSQAELSPYWNEGGYSIWGNYEMLLSQGTAGGEHLWETHATPTGYGH